MPDADLHLHSTASDGVDPPREVCRRARDAKIQTIALTDHDSVNGMPEALAAGEEFGVQVIPGCEFTAYVGNRELHILGYGLDIDSATLISHLEAFRDERRTRAERMAQKLADAGAPVDLDQILDDAGSEGAVGRVHVARALLSAGHVQSFQEAFDRYLAPGRPAYSSKLVVAPRDVIQVIHAAGGVAVLAHPGIGELLPLVPDLVKDGLDGLEVWHSLHRPDQVDRIFVLAERFGLLKTGGSDCHGALPNRGPLLGTVGVNRPHVDALKSAIARRRQTK